VNRKLAENIVETVAREKAEEAYTTKHRTKNSNTGI
jgi:putative lipoic acid-binding regulatory protein